MSDRAFAASRLQLALSAGLDHDLDRVVARDLPALAKQLGHWGHFARPVTVHVAADLAQLRAAAPLASVMDLRGLAIGDQVWLLHPQAWPDRPTDGQLGLLLAHELAHVLWFQRSTQTPRAMAYLPTWFREGFAVVASEGRPAAAQRRQLALLDIATLAYADDRQMAELGTEVYQVAAHAFASWHARCGRRGLGELWRQLRAGATFSRAFLDTCGVDDRAFVNSFAAEILSEGRQR